MEKKNELAKEERTIFIVLAIIVLIAIGVLVIWYFTKDKNLEDKDTDTKNKTVDTTKKEEDDNSSDSTYTFVPKDNETEEVVVISDDVNQQEEVEVVDVALVAKEEEVIKTQTYSYNTPYYLANESIDFSNIETKDETGEIVNILEGTIIGVNGYKADSLADEIVDVTGKYEITGQNSVTFYAEGAYGVLVMDSDKKVHEIYVVIYNDNDFNLLVDTIIDSIELKPIQSYDADKYNAFTKALADFKNIDVNDVNTRKSAYVSLIALYSELLDTYKDNVEYGTGKNPNTEVKDPEVTYGTGGAKEETEEEPKIEYGTGKNPNVQTLEEPKVEYGTGKKQQEKEEEPTIIYGTGVQQI